MSPFFVCAAFTAISAFISLGFSVASVSTTMGQTRVSALYATARSLSLALISVIAIFYRSTQWLEAVALGMVIVQALDAIIGMIVRDRMKTLGPAGMAIANLAALLWLTYS